MALIHNAVLDAALQVVVDNASRLDICSDEPASYAAIAGVSLGNKQGIVKTPQADRLGGGREISVVAITGGACTGTGTATHFALSNGSNAIYVTGALSFSQAVVQGATFALGSFKIAIPDPA